MNIKNFLTKNKETISSIAIAPIVAVGISLIFFSEQITGSVIQKNSADSKIKQQTAQQEVAGVTEPEQNPIDDIPEDVEVTETTPTPLPTAESKPEPTKNWWSYPSVITEIPISEIDLNVVMNKSRKLPASYAPDDLVLLQSLPGIRVNKTLYVRSIMIEPLTALGQAAQEEGVDLSIISAYRSYQTQISTYQNWVNYNKGNVDAADQISARPGHSEHQLGTTVDFSTNEISDQIGSQFDRTVAATWLRENAPRFGFRMSYPAGQESVTGFAHESWHFRLSR